MTDGRRLGEGRGWTTLRVSGSALVIAVAFVTPVLATATATPASADSVIDGCTVVSNPTPTHFTDCPNWNSSGAHLDGLNLAYADLAGAVFDQCTQPEFGVTPTCENSDFVNANLSSANLAGASFGLCAVAPPGGHVGCGFSDLTDANLTDANLTNTNFGTAIRPSASMWLARR